MKQKAFQEYYADNVSYCYGCGRLNEYGLQIRSYWDGEEAVCSYKPKSYHLAIPGYVYGGLIASIIDCHSTGTAAAAAYLLEDRPMGTEPQLRFVTASLHVDYLLPTPIGEPLFVRARVKETKGRKIIITSSLFVGEKECARGEVIAVRIPESWPNENNSD